ncbi:3852_t:CDS:2, partial [Diversispora eburnea]
NSFYSKKYRHEGPSSAMDLDFIEPITAKYFVKQKITKKSKSSNTANVDDQLSMQEKSYNLENEFKTRFDELKTILNNLNNPK